MDVNDISDSCPLLGLLSSPAYRTTPAVPIPDWRNEPPPPVPAVHDTGTPTQSVQTLGGTSIASQPSATSGLPEMTSALASQTAHVTAFTSSKTAASHSKPVMIPQTPQAYMTGDVALTPTNSSVTPFTPAHTQNPHLAMSALTPMASGPTQAKNSIKLQNCVSTVSVGCELKLLDIYCRTRCSEYNPSRFHGVVMRILEPRATALVFRSGKIVCTGARTEHDSYIATRKFARIVQKLGFPARFIDYKLQNLIATADLRFPVRLEALQQAHGQFTSYEPELFPGLVYRMVRPRIVLLIFVNGKIVFTGAKTRGDISEALEIIYPILHSFRKN